MPVLPSPLALGLTGYPLGHSLSPQIHAAALSHLGLSGSYQLYPVAPGTEGPGSLADLADRLRRGELHGLNVTIPHKQTVIPLLDDLTPMARAIGAVNTIFRDAGHLVGDNTDAPGFLADLERVAPGLQPASGDLRPALILGSGGGARAVVFALARAAWSVTVAPARKEDEAQAQALAGEVRQAGLSGQVVAIGFDGSAALSGSTYAKSAALLVNCTPLGMHPNPSLSPWPECAPFPSDAVVYDLVYNPAQTAFVAAARAAGLTASTGLGMLVAQAALSFERWTGLKPGLEGMRAAAEAGLQAH